MDITMLNDISRETTAPGRKFLALGGEIELGKKLLGALASGVTYISQNRSTTWIPYLDVYPDIGIDNEFASFYYSNKTPTRYTNLSKAMIAYNETVLSNASITANIGGAEKSLLRNIPKESPELELGSVRGEGYRSNAEQVTILTSKPSPENPELNTVLVLKDSKMAVVENVPRDKRFQHLDFDAVKPKFNITDIQDALNQFAIKSKGEVVFGTDEIESQLRQGDSPIAIENIFAKLDDQTHEVPKNEEWDR